jgi:hypothetical protein
VPFGEVFGGELDLLTTGEERQEACKPEALADPSFRLAHRLRNPLLAPLALLKEPGKLLVAVGVGPLATAGVFLVDGGSGFGSRRPRGILFAVQAN